MHDQAGCSGIRRANVMGARPLRVIFIAAISALASCARPDPTRIDSAAEELLPELSADLKEDDARTQFPVDVVIEDDSPSYTGVNVRGNRVYGEGPMAWKKATLEFSEGSLWIATVSLSSASSIEPMSYLWSRLGPAEHVTYAGQGTAGPCAWEAYTWSGHRYRLLVSVRPCEQRPVSVMRIDLDRVRPTTPLPD
jgi:hypothetical protein